MHLTGNELREFETAIKKNATNPSLSITIEKEGFKYEVPSADEFINDVDIPDTTTDYSIEMSCTEGRVRLSANRPTNARLRISGDKDWVHKKQQDIQRQIDKNKRVFRTLIDMPIFGLYIIQWVSIFVLQLTTPDSNGVELTLPEAIIGLVFLVFFFGWPFILLFGLEYVYPKHLLKKNESIPYRPRLRMTIKILISLLTIIGGISGFMYIVTSI